MLHSPPPLYAKLRLRLDSFHLAESRFLCVPVCVWSCVCAPGGPWVALGPRRQPPFQPGVSRIKARLAVSRFLFSTSSINFTPIPPAARMPPKGRALRSNKPTRGRWPSSRPSRRVGDSLADVSPNFPFIVSTVESSSYSSFDSWYCAASSSGIVDLHWCRQYRYSNSPDHAAQSPQRPAIAECPQGELLIGRVSATLLPFRRILIRLG